MLHKRLRLLAQIRTCADVLPENLSSSNVRQTGSAAELGSLCTLSGSRQAQKDDLQTRYPLSG